MLICDTHADTLYAMLDRSRLGTLDVTRERLAAGGDARAQALALFVGANGMRGPDADIVARELRAFDELLGQGWRQIADVGDAKPGCANVFLTVEGGEAFGDDARSVDALAAKGVLCAALVWNNENRLAYPAVSGAAEGLKPFGREVAARMRAAGMAVDVSHLNDRGVWDALESDVPPMASHSCARSLCAHPRNLSDELLRAIFAAGGFVGVNFYPVFLDASGECGLDRVVDHMARMCELGGEACVGLGSDFDGIDRYPQGLRHPGDVAALLERMRERGFGEKLVEGIAGENFGRYMKRVKG